ncbi:MAG: FMN-binding protein [Clostridia bacterium]|nr:FMN-binding protein [Clostridia bacterium]
MKKSVTSTLVLVCICAVMAILLAITNQITAPTIQANAEKAANEALLQVMPEGEGFEKMDISSYELPATVTEVYKEASGGYVIQLKTTGYSTDFIIMCGVNSDGTISGAVCLSSTETLGYEKTFGENFTGKDAAGVDAVDTISGATKTTAAYKSAIKDAINASIILGGGSVDLRDEAQILNDNLSAALPAAEGKFTKLFITEVIEGIDAVYTADNGKGYVYVIGEEFIPVDENGTANETVATAHAILTATTSEPIDLTAFEGLPTALVSAQKTSTGNYILEMKAAGYGINGGDQYHPASGEYIMIRVSLTKEGKIIDCLTVSQSESKGIGDACADESFYGQFDGKTEADYTDIDAISGATITTNGYMKAIERAFECVNILEGGAVNEE